MFNINKQEIEWCGRTLSIETGKVARQADGSVLATYGETSVLCTVVGAKDANKDIGFFPLTVHYKEMYFASGKIPGGFFKREGKPTEREVLISRLIDRPIRPLFPDGFKNEVQVICTVLSYDGINDSDVVAMVGASAALSLSGLPFQGPIAGIRVGMADGEFVFNPEIPRVAEMDLDLVVAGTSDSVLMVESEANQLTEEQMLMAVTEGHKHMQPVIEMIHKLTAQAGKEAREYTSVETDAKLRKAIEQLVKKDLEEAYKETGKQVVADKVNVAKAKLAEAYAENEEFNSDTLNGIFKEIQREIVRGNIIKNGMRIDGRDNKTVRPISAEVSYLPRTHGSALFTRGETQAVVVTTLGGSSDEQIIDTMVADYKDHFMLHYNFPPYSVGEVYMLKPPGRREIGHGKLAWRAIKPVMPSKADFPYAIRTVSEITESNGSSSMATVCGTALSLMDAGVPIKAPVAGIAMGLVKEGNDFVVLSDILGDEDHLGDMDFKVAGTSEGITALQMDIKIAGITPEIMKIALEQAKAGRIHILGKMAESMNAPRTEVSKYAPVIAKIQVAKDKIGGVIGPGGKMIKSICEQTGATVDIDDSGMAFISAPNNEAAEQALAMIEEIITEPVVGQVYQGTVTKMLDFGAVVKYFGSREGLVHISEVQNEKVIDINDHLSEGDEVKVQLISLDDRGKARLSIRLADQETGEALEDTRPKTPRAPSTFGGNGRRDRNHSGDHKSYGNKDRDRRHHPKEDRRHGEDRRRGDYAHSKNKPTYNKEASEPKEQNKEKGKSTFRKLFKL